MTVALLRGDAHALPLATGTVDLIVTSPPYFGLRSYTDGGEHYSGQIGSEVDPAEYVDALIAATTEMVRVLKPSGSIWVNLGDKYAGSPSGPRTTGPAAGRQFSAATFTKRTKYAQGAPSKSLMGLPWRYALRCIDELGLILRAEVIWSKPNGLPESVTDRVRRSHEQWFHFTVQPRYFAGIDAIRTPYDGERALSRRMKHTGGPGKSDVQQSARPWTVENPLGSLPSSVWSVPTQPLTVPESLGVDHFAAFPMEWPRRIIRGWSPSGICTRCGEGRRPVAASAGGAWHDHADDAQSGLRQGAAERSRRYRAHVAAGTNGTRISGERCGCPEPTAPTRPAIVLDPFGGAGTVAMVADALGRHGVSVDMSGDYCRLASWRSNDPGERAKAAQVERPPAQPDDMDALW